MGMLRSFLPWIAFAALSGVSWPLSAAAGFVLGLVLVVNKRRSGTTWDCLILEAGSMGYFLIVGVVALAEPNSFLRPYSGAGSMVWLGLIAWASLLAGTPFTMGMAKQITPPEVWRQPNFKHSNMVITTFWAACFTITGPAVAIAYASTHKNGYAGGVQLLGFVVAVLLTMRYRAHVRAKQAAAATTVTA